MSEYIIIGIVTLSSALFALGGTLNKSFRRYLMPAVLAAGAYLLGIPLPQSIVAFFAISLVSHLGYGDNSNLLKKIIVIFSYAAALIPLATGVNGLLTLIVPIAFGGTYLLSRKYNWFTWKLAELTGGFAFGVTVVLLALTR